MRTATACSDGTRHTIWTLLPSLLLQPSAQLLGRAWGDNLCVVALPGAWRGPCASMQGLEGDAISSLHGHAGG